MRLINKIAAIALAAGIIIPVASSAQTAGSYYARERIEGAAVAPPVTVVKTVCNATYDVGATYSGGAPIVTGTTSNTNFSTGRVAAQAICGDAGAGFCFIKRTQTGSVYQFESTGWKNRSGLTWAFTGSSNPQYTSYSCN